MSSKYIGREQTRAKHFILRNYLQSLAFKILFYRELTFVDGFSGPWKNETEDYSDCSFMIAISVLMDAQKQLEALGRSRPKIRCFFSESNPLSFTQLQNAVARFNKPAEDFEVVGPHWVEWILFREDQATLCILQM